MAARSICHRFVRLFDPSMPEKPTEESYAAFSSLARMGSNVPCRMAEMKSVDAFFPSPQQVANTDIPTLRTAGLSARKAEYGGVPLLSRFSHPLSADWGSVQDLAAHFADGRLSTEKLLAAEDEELYTMLTSIRGIGRVSAVPSVLQVHY